MTTKGAQFSIDGTAVKIVSASSAFQGLNIHTDGAIYLNDSNAVSTSNGFKLDVGDQGKYTIAPYTEIWAISNGLTTKTVYTLVTLI